MAAYRPNPWLRRYRALRLRMPNPLAKDLRPPSCKFALIGCQRSGTHLLREIVNSNPHVALMVEPFSPHQKPVQWCNFVRRIPAKLYPPFSPYSAMALLDRHMRMIRRDVYIEQEWYGGAKPHLKALGLDVKYNQLRSVNPIASDLLSRPVLLDYFKDRGFRILHLVRKNIAHASISLILANMRNVWHNYDAKTIGGQYRIPWETLHLHMNWMRAERDEFLRLAHDMPILTCVYEDLVGDLTRVDQTGSFPSETTVLRPLADFLGVPNQFCYDGKMRKVINRPYAEILENFDELVRELRASEFSEFADTLGAVGTRGNEPVLSKAA